MIYIKKNYQRTLLSRHFRLFSFHIHPSNSFLKLTKVLCTSISHRRDPLSTEASFRARSISNEMHCVSFSVLKQKL